MLPSCSRPSRTLRAAEGGGPEDGPILDRHCARRLGLRRSGRKDGPRSNRRMRGDFPLPLPTCRGELGKRKPRMRLAEPISFRSGRPVDCHNSNLASFYVALAHHSTRANSIRRTPRPSLPRQILKRPWSKLATRTDHKPSETVTRNPGGWHQKPCSGSTMRYSIKSNIRGRSMVRCLSTLPNRT